MQTKPQNELWGKKQKDNNKWHRDGFGFRKCLIIWMDADECYTLIKPWKHISKMTYCGLKISNINKVKKKDFNQRGS